MKKYYGCTTDLLVLGFDEPGLNPDSATLLMNNIPEQINLTSAKSLNLGGYWLIKLTSTLLEPQSNVLMHLPDLPALKTQNQNSHILLI